MEPDKGPELSAYRETIQAARTHQWEFVIKYDRQFRKAAAVDRSKCWARVDSSLFMQELAGPQAALEPGLQVGGLNTLAPGKGQGTRALGVTREAQTGGRGLGHATSSMECAPMGLGANSATRVPDAGGLHPSSRCNGPHMEWRSGQAGGTGTGPGQSVGGQHAWKGN